MLPEQIKLNNISKDRSLQQEVQAEKMVCCYQANSHRLRSNCKEITFFNHAETVKSWQIYKKQLHESTMVSPEDNGEHIMMVFQNTGKVDKTPFDEVF